MATHTNKLRRAFRQLGGSALLAALAIGAGAQEPTPDPVPELMPEPDRLLIELMPVYVIPDDAVVPDYSKGTDSPFPEFNEELPSLERGWQPLREIFVMTHEALGILGVEADEYDLVLAEDGYLTMRCSGITSAFGSKSVCDPTWPNAPPPRRRLLRSAAVVSRIRIPSRLAPRRDGVVDGARFPGAVCVDYSRRDRGASGI